jgi:cysteine-rich repeat protein
MQRFSAHFLVSALVLTACPGDDKVTTESTSDTSTTTATTGPQVTTDEATTEAPTTVQPTTSTTDEPTTEPPTTLTTDPTTETTDPTTGTTTNDDTTTNVMTTGDGLCGDGMVGADEACDDSNNKTEISPSTKSPLVYTATDCIDDCSLVLSLCGNGEVDPGEACDDGNQDSYDACTTSCTMNDKAYHAPCKRMCQQNCDTDVSSGTFTGCEDMEVPEGAEAVCYVSTKFALAPRYFAEGECATTAQTCDGGILCPPDIGDYDALNSCPAGTTLIDRTTMAAGITVKTKVCQKTCESDSDCRWNSFDTIWGKSGEFRCQVTPDSNDIKICADVQN